MKTVKEFKFQGAPATSFSFNSAPSSTTGAHSCGPAGAGSVRGRVVVLDCRRHSSWQFLEDEDINAVSKDIQDAIPALTREDAAGVMVILDDDAFDADDEGRPHRRLLDKISAAPSFLLMLVPASEARVLAAARGATIDVFLGARGNLCAARGACVSGASEAHMRGAPGV